MKKLNYKIIILLAAVLLLTEVLPVTAWADTAEPTWEDALETTDEYLEQNVKENSTDNAWSVFARGRNLDADHTEDYYIDYYESVDVDAINTSGDCAKTLLALRASGRGDSDKAAAIKEKLLDWDDNQAWLTESPYSVPVIIESLSGELAKSGNATEREGLIGSINAAIIDRYDYGWGVDVDSTAMAATALTTVTGHDSQIDEILTWISDIQNTEGNISGAWGTSPETTAQAVVALSEDRKIDDTPFVKGGKSTIDGLMTFYDNTKLNDGGGFAGGYDPVMRAQQVNYALVAYDRYNASKTNTEITSLLDFSDVTAVYYFSFDGNGASNTMKTQAIESGDTENINANTLIRQGYIFTGWKDADGNTYTDEQAVTASKDVKLYAVWKRVTTESTSQTFEYINLNNYYDEVMRVDSYNAVSGEWIQNDSKKYLFFVDGQQVKGRWVKAINPAASNFTRKAGWFYFDDNGEMLTGWQKIKDANGVEKWYYLNPHPDAWYGACFINTITPDGYAVDRNGAWMDPATVSEEVISKVTENAGSDGSSSVSTGNTDAGENAAKNVSKISVSVSVSGNTVSGSDEVTLSKNASAYDALKALAKKMGWNISGSSSYVKGIGGEMEKSAGVQSGWTYSVNGTTPNKSAGSCKLKDGDSVDWTFVDGADY